MPQSLTHKSQKAGLSKKHFGNLPFGILVVKTIKNNTFAS